MYKNSLRGITLVRGPTWGIHSLTLITSWLETNVTYMKTGLTMSIFNCYRSEASGYHGQVKFKRTTFFAQPLYNNTFQASNDRYDIYVICRLGVPSCKCCLGSELFKLRTDPRDIRNALRTNNSAKNQSYRSYRSKQITHLLLPCGKLANKLVC